MLLNVNLYQILTGQSGEYKIRPDLFINNPEYRYGKLKFSTGARSSSVITTFKFYIPFTNSGLLVTDYKNGVYEVSPTTQILVLSTPSPSDIHQVVMSGVYAMDSTQFEEIYLDDNLMPVQPTKIKDVPTIKRYDPVSLSPNNTMRNFYNDVVSGQIKLSL